MSHDYWQRLANVFERVVDVPTEEREAFLQRECDEPTIRRAVESLLEADRNVGAFLEEPLIEKLDAPDHRPATEDLTSTRIGSYRLVRKIGEGGLSTVYLAVRDDDAFRRRVAVKIIRQGMESEDAVRRLRTERQILASLNHPYVARLYHGGRLENNAPYFIMEYVEGMPIDAYCDQSGLNLRQRVALFRKVCEAVEYAHRNLIVHRDLKPHNILVTADGTPKLLDFGIAKILNPELSALDLEETQTWLRLLTPNYASPEQVRGEAITTATDVYSLGVLLFKLLAGRLPYSFEDGSPTGIEKILTETPPPRPSKAARDDAGDNALSRQLRGDLDHIVLKAMRAVPEHRYHSVEQLSEDLRRYLSGFPVLARRGTSRYRVGRFLRRNWATVAGIAGFVALVSAFAVSMLIQSARVIEERDKALRERDEKEHVLALIEDVFRMADPNRSGGRRLTVQEALDRGATGIGQHLKDQPGVGSRLDLTIGTIYLNLALLDEAESHLRRSLALRERLYGAASLEVVEAQSLVGAMLRERGDFDAAEKLLKDSVRLVRDLVGSDHPSLIGPLNHLVTLYCYRGDYQAAESLSAEALELTKRFLDRTSSSHVAAVTNRAVVLHRDGKIDEAAGMYHEALRLQRLVRGDEYPEIANLLNNLAIVFKDQGRIDEAVGAQREALALRQRLYEPGHMSIAQSWTNLASSLRRQGSFEEALHAYDEALTILRGSLGAAHPLTARVTLAKGKLLIEAGVPADAQTLLETSLEQWRFPLADDPALLARAGSLLGEALMRQRRYAAAEPLLVDGVETLRRTHGLENRHTRDALERLIALYDATEDAARGDAYRRMMTQ